MKVFGKFFQMLFVIGAVVIDAFVDTEVLAVFDGLQSMAAIGTLEL